MSHAAPPAGTEGSLAAVRAVFEEHGAAGRLELPLLPQVAARVLAMSREESVDAARLSALIQGDQALASHVLRVANSVMFQARTSIQSLQQATARLGMQVLTEIALSASLRSKLFRVEGQDELVRRLWRHAAASGCWAKEISRIRRRNVESAFLCGLLHDIGKPIVLAAVVALGQKQPATTLTEGDLQTLMADYGAEVGTMVARKWQLPAQVQESIRHWSAYLEAPRFREEATTTHLADTLAGHLLGPDAPDEEQVRESEVVAELNLYPQDMDALLARREPILSVVEAMSF